MKITNAGFLRLTVSVCALSTLLLLFMENTVAQELKVVTKAQLNSTYQLTLDAKKSVAESNEDNNEKCVPAYVVR